MGRAHIYHLSAGQVGDDPCNFWGGREQICPAQADHLPTASPYDPCENAGSLIYRHWQDNKIKCQGEAQIPLIVITHGILSVFRHGRIGRDYNLSQNNWTSQYDTKRPTSKQKHLTDTPWRRYCCDKHHFGNFWTNQKTRIFLDETANECEVRRFTYPVRSRLPEPK